MAVYLGDARPRCPLLWLLMTCLSGPLGLILWDQPKSPIAAPESFLPGRGERLGIKTPEAFLSSAAAGRVGG